VSFKFKDHTINALFIYWFKAYGEGKERKSRCMNVKAKSDA